MHGFSFCSRFFPGRQPSVIVYGAASGRFGAASTRAEFRLKRSRGWRANQAVTLGCDALHLFEGGGPAQHFAVAVLPEGDHILTEGSVAQLFGVGALSND